MTLTTERSENAVKRTPSHVMNFERLQGKKKLSKQYCTTVASDFGHVPKTKRTSHEAQARAATEASGENSNNITSEINVEPLLEPSIPVVFIDFDDCRSCSEQLLPLKPVVVFLTLSKNLWRLGRYSIQTHCLRSISCLIILILFEKQDTTSIFVTGN